jgi:hypothetical protein
MSEVSSSLLKINSKININDSGRGRPLHMFVCAGSIVPLGRGPAFGLFPGVETPGYFRSSSGM